MAHCLIVDDSRVIRTVARRIFEELHFITGEAEDGMAALRAAREKMPDLILLDWSMPGMTGLEFVRSLRAQPDGDRPSFWSASPKWTPARSPMPLPPGLTITS